MNSNHPIAKSVLEFSNRKGISLKYDQVSSHEEVSGQGIIAIIENEKYFAGNEKMMINILLINYWNRNRIKPLPGTSFPWPTSWGIALLQRALSRKSRKNTWSNKDATCFRAT